MARPGLGTDRGTKGHGLFSCFTAQIWTTRSHSGENAHLAFNHVQWFFLTKAEYPSPFASNVVSRSIFERQLQGVVHT